MGANPPSLLAWPSVHMSEVSALVLSYSFEKTPLWCHLPLLTSTWLSTQSNSLTIPESIWVTGSCCPSLLPAPGVIRIPNFSGTAPAGDHHPSQCTLLAVCHLLLFIPPVTLPVQVSGGEGSRLPHFGRGGSHSMAIRTWISSNTPEAAAAPWSLRVSLQNLLTALF